ncbi:MAG: imidazole glycerol phosphate synthase subunit HisH [Eubacterium sp.]|nr:imidazole glycerol phosphate synthase subunit HisH [Eubacterium sp.]
MIAIIDYGAGNLFSLASSLKHIGAEAEITGDTEAIRKADRMILPGVGAFGDAAAELAARGLDKVICEEAHAGKPLMGICLGMQLLFEQSLEYGEHEGLGLIKGTVRPLQGYLPEGYKIPQIGWNSLEFHGEKHPVFRDVPDGAFVYFVHSYYGDADVSQLAATCDYGNTVTAAVTEGNVVGCQFHPEKSGEVGLSILKAFCDL